MITIYALHSGDYDFKYVGFTRRTATDRLSGHLRKATYKSDTRDLYCWIRSLDCPPQVLSLETCDDADCDLFERKWIAILRSSGFDLFNRSQGGRGPSGYDVSDETRALLSQVLTGKKKPPRTSEHIENLREANRGSHSVTDDTRARLKSSVKAAWDDPEKRARIIAGRVGKKRSEQAKANMKAAQQRRRAEERK